MWGGTGVRSIGNKPSRQSQPFRPLLRDHCRRIEAGNVGEALRLFRPWGVDVVSGIERETGKKDEVKLRKICRSGATTRSRVRQVETMEDRSTTQIPPASTIPAGENKLPKRARTVAGRFGVYGGRYVPEILHGRLAGT